MDSENARWRRSTFMLFGGAPGSLMTDDLTPDEKPWAFRRATNSMSGSDRRWTERATAGLIDEQLAEAVRYELGQYGGSSGHANGLAVEHESSGLKLWAGRGAAHRHSTPPMCAGPATLRLAREVYGIKDPNGTQMSLL
jgi:hypothetical protein